jgi:hypothetical protein
MIDQEVPINLSLCMGGTYNSSALIPGSGDAVEVY